MVRSRGSEKLDEEPRASSDGASDAAGIPGEASDCAVRMRRRGSEPEENARFAELVPPMLAATRQRIAEMEEEVIRGSSGPVSENIVEDGSSRFFHVRALEGPDGVPAGTVATGFMNPSEDSGEIIQLLHRTLYMITTASPVSAGDLARALPFIAEAAMEASSVDRVSIWVLETAGSAPALRCIALEDREGGATAADMPLLEAPSYVEMLSKERIIESADVASDPRFSEFMDGYFGPCGITSTLDAPIHMEGSVAGVICVERTKSGPRPWVLQDQVLAASLAEITSMTMETARQTEVSLALDRLQAEKAMLLDGVEDVVLHISPDLRILWGNRAAASAMCPGHNPALPPGLEELLEARLPEGLREALADAGREFTRSEMEYPDSRFRFTSVSRLAGDEGYVLFAHDVTERRHSTRLQDATRRIIESGLTSMDSPTLYREIHSIISEVVPADNYYISLYDPLNDILSFPYYVDKYTTPPEPRKPGRGFTEMVLRGGKPLFLSESDIARYISDGQTELIGVLSNWWMGVPLTVGDRVFGVMTVQSYSGGSIDQKMKDALLTLAGAAALVIEKRKTEDSLKGSESRYRALAENAKDGIVLITDGRVVYVNDTLAAMLGYPSAAYVNHDFSEFVAESERAKVVSRHFARIRGGQVPGIYETVLRKFDGTEIPVELNVSIISDQGKPGVLGIIRDISDRRRIEDEKRMLDRQIQHSQKLESLGVLAGGIAHDFNNLLMGILGNAGLALMELPPESPVRRTIERLETAAMRAAELTNQLLAYSGRGKFMVEPVDMNRVIEEMVNLLQAAIPKNVVLRLDLAHELDMIEGDATQLRQIVMNLIMNAAEAIGERSGIITIATGMTYVDRPYLSGTYIDEDLPEGPYSFLEVSDTGCGMDEKIRAKIFDPFFTTKFTGRGLGLAAVLGIVRGHRGTLKVYSEPGRGSSFKILLPAIGGRAANPQQQTDQATIGRGTTVLVVDDEETVRTVARLSLEKCGFGVLTAVDGRECTEIFRENAGRIDLVLLDMTMPHLNGEEAFRELRRIRPDIRVILSSGYNEMDAAGRFSGKGLAGFIQKPYRPVDLIAKVRSVVAPDTDRAGT